MARTPSLARRAAGCALAAGLALAAPAAAAPGDLDPAFGTDGILSLDRPPAGLVATGDGGTVVLDARWRVTKRDAAGAPAGGFGTAGVVDVFADTSDRMAAALAVDGEGRLLVAGHGTDPNAPAYVARLEPDGDLDPTWGGGDGIAQVQLGPGATQSVATTVEALPSGDVAVAGSFAAGGGSGIGAVVLSGVNGVVEAGPLQVFGAGDQLFGSAVDAEGRLLLGGAPAIADSELGRWNPDLTPAFAPVNPIRVDWGDGDPATPDVDFVKDVEIGPSGAIVALVLRASGAGVGSNSLVWDAGTDGTGRASAVFGGAAPTERFSMLALGVEADGDRWLAGDADRGPATPVEVVVSAVTPDGQVDVARGGERRHQLPGVTNEQATHAELDGVGVLWVAGRADVSAGVPSGFLMKVQTGRQQPGPQGGGGGGGGPITPEPPVVDAPSQDGPATPEVVVPPAARLAPLARFSGAPKRRARVRALAGTAEAGAERIELALVRRAQGRCRALRDAGAVAFAARVPKGRACAPTAWVSVEGAERWTLRLGRALPRGRYVAFVRAVAPGTQARPLRVKAGNKIRFRIR